MRTVPGADARRLRRPGGVDATERRCSQVSVRRHRPGTAMFNILFNILIFAHFN